MNNNNRLFPFTLDFPKIELADGSSKGNLFIYLLCCFTQILLFVFINSLQSFVISEILQEDSSKLGDLTGSLTFYDEILVLITVTAFGLLSDFAGSRVPIFILAFSLEAIGLSLFCYASSYYPDLIVYRLIFALGASAGSGMITAQLADIAIDSSRGFLAGLVGFVSGLGAIFSVSFLLPLPAQIGLKGTFMVGSGISSAMVILLVYTQFFYQKMHPLVENEQSQDQEVQELDLDGNEEEEEQPLIPSTSISSLQSKSTFQLFSMGILHSCNSPPLILGHMSSFLARGDSICLSLFLPLWIYKYHVESGLCPSRDGMIRDVCRQAYIDAAILSGSSQVFSLIGAPIVGWILDFVGRRQSYNNFARIPVSIGASLLAGLGYFLQSQTSNPASKLNIIYLALVGLGEIGLIVSSATLVTHSDVPAQIRGVVSGLASFCGALGILAVSKVGGVLFDTVSPGSPFLLVASLHLVYLALGSGILLYKRMNI